MPLEIGIGIGIGAGGGVSALPTTFTDIAGLVIDYDAEREASSTQITDFSGGGRHGTQTEAGKRPVRSATGFGTNSKAYWQGAVGAFWLPPTSSYITTGIHVFAVIQASGISSGGLHRWGSSGSSSETPFSSAIYDDAGSNTRNQSSNIGTTFNTSPVVYSILGKASLHQMKRGSTTIFTTAVNTFGVQAQPVLGGGGLYNSGANTTSSYFQGKFARYLVFDRDVSASEATILARLNAIYGTS